MIQIIDTHPWISLPQLVVTNHNHCAVNVSIIRISKNENYFPIVSWKQQWSSNHCSTHPINVFIPSTSSPLSKVLTFMHLNLSTDFNTINKFILLAWASPSYISSLIQASSPSVGSSSQQGLFLHAFSHVSVPSTSSLSQQGPHLHAFQPSTKFVNVGTSSSHSITWSNNYIST